MVAKVIVAHLGARKHYQEPILFYQWGVLERFYTDLYAGHSQVAKLLRSPTLYSHLPSAIQKGLDRFDQDLENAPVTHFPAFGLHYIQRLKQTSPQEASAIYNWAGKEFCRRIIQQGFGNANTVYGFPVASLELFQHAKNSLRCVLDQTIAERAFTYRLVEEEEARWPNWSSTPFTLKSAELELIDREHQEQALADHIVCGSEFVKDSLITSGIDAAKISVVALGRLKDKLPQQFDRPPQQTDELKILFAGAITLRKGIPDLLKALRLLKGKIPFVCKAAGSLEIKPERVAEYSDVCEFLGRVPRSQMNDLYAWADVFVLPSLVEGSAMVTYEALMCGVPIITTYNAGSLVRDGVDGYIVNIRDPEAIADRLTQLYQQGLPVQPVTKQPDLTRRFADYQETLRTLICNPDQLNPAFSAHRS